MKDVKSYIIGFLTCACLFLIMGQTQVSNNLGDIEVNSITIRDNGNGGFIQSFNTDGKETMYAGTGIGGFGIVTPSNADGKETMYAGTKVGGGGMIQLSNTFGNATSLLSTNANEDGVINLFDRYGEYGWGMSGKK